MEVVNVIAEYFYYELLHPCYTKGMEIVSRITPVSLDSVHSLMNIVTLYIYIQ